MFLKNTIDRFLYFSPPTPTRSNLLFSHSQTITVDTTKLNISMVPPAPASTASLGYQLHPCLVLWMAVMATCILRLVYICCNHLFAGLLQSLASSGCAATTKTIGVCASSASASHATAHGGDATMLMCRSDGNISHDIPRLIPDRIPTEEIHGNTLVIPSAHRVRPQGILSFTIEQHQEVSIIYYI